MAQNPQRQVHHERAGLIFHARNRRAISQSILPKDRTKSRTKQWRLAIVVVPRCTVVAGPIDLYTGGEGSKDPDEEANLINDRALSYSRKE